MLELAATGVDPRIGSSRLPPSNPSPPIQPHCPLLFGLIVPPAWSTTVSLGGRKGGGLDRGKEVEEQECGSPLISEQTCLGSCVVWVSHSWSTCLPAPLPAGVLAVSGLLTPSPQGESWWPCSLAHQISQPSPAPGNVFPVATSSTRLLRALHFPVFVPSSQVFRIIRVGATGALGPLSRRKVVWITPS